MKICFWGDNASALEGNPAGGGELQMALLAKALVKSGHKVVFLDYNISEGFVTSEGVEVKCITGYNDGIRFLRAFRRLQLIYLVLKNQKADVYYCRIRDFRHILAFWASRKVNAKFILALASDLDVKDTRARLKYLYFAETAGAWWLFNGLLSEIVYSWLLRNSDLVLVQHEGQKKSLRQKGISSTILYNLIEMNNVPVSKKDERNDFCYVGSLDRRKGFVDFFNLVKSSQLYNYKIIGSPRDKTGEKYFDKLKMLKNATLLGRLNHSDTLSHIAGSRALISTSPLEGFPNIFIEAWACGIPVLSLYVDPGNVIEREGLGFVAKGDIMRLSSAMAEIRITTELETRMKAYVFQNHVLNEARLIEINKVFCDLVEK
jgi:glycosyltransferase involved in cell wall biosynthesis